MPGKYRKSAASIQFKAYAVDAYRVLFCTFFFSCSLLKILLRRKFPKEENSLRLLTFAVLVSFLGQTVRLKPLKWYQKLVFQLIVFNSLYLSAYYGSELISVVFHSKEQFEIQKFDDLRRVESDIVVGSNFYDLIQDTELYEIIKSKLIKAASSELFLHAVSQEHPFILNCLVMKNFLETYSNLTQSYCIADERINMNFHVYKNHKFNIFSDKFQEHITMVFEGALKHYYLLHDRSTKRKKIDKLDSVNFIKAKDFYPFMGFYVGCVLLACLLFGLELVWKNLRLKLHRFGGRLKKFGGSIWRIFKFAFRHYFLRGRRGARNRRLKERKH